LGHSLVHARKKGERDATGNSSSGSLDGTVTVDAEMADFIVNDEDDEDEDDENDGDGSKSKKREGMVDADTDSDVVMVELACKMRIVATAAAKVSPTHAQQADTGNSTSTSNVEFSSSGSAGIELHSCELRGGKKRGVDIAGTAAGTGDAQKSQKEQVEYEHLIVGVNSECFATSATTTTATTAATTAAATAATTAGRNNKPLVRLDEGDVLVSINGVDVTQKPGNEVKAMIWELVQRWKGARGGRDGGDESGGADAGANDDFDVGDDVHASFVVRRAVLGESYEWYMVYY
jgi:hypothetical protein